MGAYVSIPECRSHYNVTIDCSHSNFDNETQTYVKLGGFGPGEFPGNPDVAGIGIVGVFVGVTCFALAISAVDVLWQTAKAMGWKSTRSEEEKRREPDRISFTDILESLVLTCSDQQVFTGAAYALTLRYWQGCKISAYHYNIVGNMMLISCATHLLSVTVVRHYWQYPLLALLRVLCVTGVFIVTGLLLVNQNAADADVRFPTEVPPANATSSLLFLSAACFETDNSPLRDTFRNTTSDAETFFAKNLHDSTPGNTIHGWNWYIILLMYYLLAIVAEGIRYFRRHRDHAGWRGKPGRRLARIIKPHPHLRKLITCGNLLYLTGGIVVSSIAVIKSIVYIFQLRGWVARSGWVEEDNGINPEDDWSSFGQLVPIFMSGFILFSVAQIVSEKVTQKRKHKHANEEMAVQDGTTVFYSDPSQQYSILNNSNAPNDGKVETANYTVTQTSSPPTQSFPSNTSTGSSSNINTPRASSGTNSIGSTPHLPGLGLQNTSPLLGHGSSIVSPPSQSVAATPPRPLTSRYSSGYFAAGSPPANAGPVSPPSPTPAASSRPPSGTYTPLAQQDGPGQLQGHSRGASGGAWSVTKGRQT